MRINFAQRRFVALVSALLLLIGHLTGCASSRVLKNPPPPIEAGLGWTGSAPEGITVEVHQLIVRDSGGSWVRDANWDEYVLRIRNDSQDGFEIQGINLYSDKLPTPVESSNSREQLEARSNGTLRALKDVGIVAGLGLVAPSALIIGAIGTSGGILSASAAAGTAAVIGIVAIPVGLIGGTAYVISRHHRDKDDKVKIDGIIRERGLAVPLQIPPGTEIQKSAFFPITPAPNRLVVTATNGSVTAQVSVELPALAGLHLKGKPAKAPSVDSAGAAAAKQKS